MKWSSIPAGITGAPQQRQRKHSSLQPKREALNSKADASQRELDGAHDKRKHSRMCQNPTSLPMENRQKKCVKCPNTPRRKQKKIEIARLLLWASFATPLSAAPHQTRLQIPGAPGAPGNRRKPGQSQLPPYSLTKRTLARTSTCAAFGERQAPPNTR